MCSASAITPFKPSARSKKAVESPRCFPSSGTCCGCFRPSESEPLSDVQLLDYPWGGYPGPGAVVARKLAFETGELPFDEDSFYLYGEERYPDTYEVVTRFLKQVRRSKHRNYELVKIEKAVETSLMLVYLTFTAAERFANAPVLTFQAMVDVPFGWAPVRGLCEWRIIPDPAAISGA